MSPTGCEPQCAVSVQGIGEHLRDWLWPVSGAPVEELQGDGVLGVLGRAVGALGALPEAAPGGRYRPLLADVAQALDGALSRQRSGEVGRAVSLAMLADDLDRVAAAAPPARAAASGPGVLCE